MGDEKPVIFNTLPVAKVDSATVEDLKARARARADKRFRLCLHHGPDDLVHQMLIVHGPGVYVRPHRHDHQVKSIHAIEGRLLVALFDDAGTIVDRFVMGPHDTGRCFLVRIEKGAWHTELPLGDLSVFLETLQGPFRPQTHSTFAPWSPESGDTRAVEQFVNSLLQGGSDA